MAKQITHRPARHGPMRARLLVLAACVVLLYVVVPQIGGFRESLAMLRDVRWLPVAAAAILVVTTYMTAATMYWLLALRPVRYSQALLVQGASAFANRILPAGLGGLTLNVQFLRKHRHTATQAVVVAGTNNLLGFVGHALLLVVAIALAGNAAWDGITLPHVPTAGYVAAAGLLAALVVVASIGRLRHKLFAIVRTAGRQFAHYRRHPFRLALALTCSLFLTLAYVAIFYASGEALGASLSPVEALVVFTVGMLIGTAVPTPGGLGGLEAGLVAGGVAYGQPAGVALAVALLFRLLTYWLPLLPGFVFFVAARKQYGF